MLASLVLMNVQIFCTIAIMFGLDRLDMNVTYIIINFQPKLTPAAVYLTGRQDLIV